MLHYGNVISYLMHTECIIQPRRVHVAVLGIVRCQAVKGLKSLGELAGGRWQRLKGGSEKCVFFWPANIIGIGRIS